jgi:hypothetical protein
MITVRHPLSCDGFTHASIVRPVVSSSAGPPATET